MIRTLAVRLSAGLIALGCAWVAYTQAPPQQGKTAGFEHNGQDIVDKVKLHQIMAELKS